LKIPSTKRVGGVAQAVECLASKGGAPSSNPKFNKKKISNAFAMQSKILIRYFH
jgi:hypothetical protein